MAEKKAALKEYEEQRLKKVLADAAANAAAGDGARAAS